MLKNKRLIAFLLVPAIFIGISHYAGGARSASLTSASVTLSNPRLSFRGILSANNSAGTSQVEIDTGASQPSLSTAQLQEGDAVSIGESFSMGAYTVFTTSPAADFSITTALASGDADTGDDVVSTQSADLTVRFTTATAISNGRFRILVPALSDNTNATDGIPDGGFFDFSEAGATITCPGDVAGQYDFVAGTATASAITIDSTDYHAFECAYSGTGGVGTIFDGGGGNEGVFLIEGLINPAPESGHATGTADTSNILIQHFDSAFAVTDSTSVSIGVIEAVKVTVSVPASISFSIAGVASSTSVCGITTGVTTTAAAVPFGEVVLSAFTDAAQILTVTTNAINGYVVTAIENDQLGLDGGTCTGDSTAADCIRDSAGDDATMGHDTSIPDYDDWDNTATKGFAYSMQNDDAASTAFEYSTVAGDCAGGTYCAMQFADAENSQTAQTIFSSTTVADDEDVNVCYRVLPNVNNAAGDYQNFVTYTATATF